MAHKELATNETSWTFLTNHSHVLICIAKQPDIRLSEVADLVGIGERSVHRIVHDLESAGYLRVIKEGRRNVYRIDLDRPLRHPMEADHHVRAVITPLVKKSKVTK
ncbi:MAG: helix-turn-helix domain-containing protein [Ilumatobacteraceae bacterium]|jgi:DNA-binding IclR family transcriptional regulator|nr:helix-turn-helix domain-containing protein [Ilumatobacteraceae bacterium]